jgi:hypothetical protein
MFQGEFKHIDYAIHVNTLGNELSALFAIGLS